MWNLPTQTEIDGEIYTHASDYRDILDIVKYLQSDEDEETKSAIALHLFYDNLRSIKNMQTAADYFASFINCFDKTGDQSRPKLIDWEQDANMIASEINKVAGMEVRQIPYLHWFTFVGYFYAIGDGQLATVCSIRKKIYIGKKLEKWEQQYYIENKSRVDI